MLLSLKLSFLEARPFYEILSRLDTDSFADFCLSTTLIYFPFLCSGGRECPFQVLVAFSVNDELMLFVQHLAERGFRSRLGLSSSTAMLKEWHCSGNITGAGDRGGQWFNGFSGFSGFQGSVGEVIPIWSFSIARGEENALRGVSSPVRTGERWEWALGGTSRNLPPSVGSRSLLH